MRKRFGFGVYLLCFETRNSGLEKQFGINLETHLRPLSPPISLLVFVLNTVLLAAPLGSQAEPIYRHVNENGRVTFSSTPPTSRSKPESLPTIKRENSESRIQSLKHQTPSTCNPHGGVDCSKGADKDGSVICGDGTRDSGETFSEFCAQVRLQIDEPVVYDRDGKEFKPRTPAEMDKIGEAHIVVRNLSAVAATQLSGELRFPRPNAALSFSGPEQVDPYGLAEYTANLSDARKMYLQKFLQMKPAFRCANCLIVLGSH